MKNDIKQKELRATRTLVRYAVDAGLTANGPSSIQATEFAQRILTGLLTDLRHTADFQGLDIYRALDASYQQYLVDRQGKS